MIDYKCEYLEQITRLYKDYIDAFYLNSKNSKKKKEEIERMNELLKEIVGLTNVKYLDSYNALVNKKNGSLDDKLDTLHKLEDLIRDRINVLEEYASLHEEVTKVDLSSIFDIGSLSSSMDIVSNKITIINNYLANLEEAKKINLDNEDTKVKLDKLNAKKEINDNINKEMEEELNVLLNKIISDNDGFNLDKNVVMEYFMQYQELYSKACEQVSDNSITQELYDMAKSNYLEYSIENALVKLRDIMNEVACNYLECVLKRKMIRDIIHEGLDSDVFSSLEELLDKQGMKLELQDKDIKEEELLTSVMDNNNKRLHELEELNKRECVLRVISLDSDVSSKSEDVSSLKVEDGSNCNVDKDGFHVVEVSPIDVIKNPYAGSDKNASFTSNDIITKKYSAPNWLVYAVVESEHKFINWFDKLNALIKRKRYLKDER